MTTTAIDASPRADEVNLAVSRVVKVLLAHRGQTQAQLSAATGFRRSTLIRRMHGERDWTAPEVAILAKHFEVPVSVFYDGPDALLSRGVRTPTHQYQSPTKPAGTTVSPLKPSSSRRPLSTAVRPCPGSTRAA